VPMLPAAVHPGALGWTTDEVSAWAGDDDGTGAIDGPGAMDDALDGPPIAAGPFAILVYGSNLLYCFQEGMTDAGYAVTRAVPAVRA